MANKNSPFQKAQIVYVALLILLVSACGNNEESGKELKLDERYDEIRDGTHLVLTFDVETNSFDGYVENTTDESLEQVRVEVHLSNGVELGPTPAVDLGPGERTAVSLPATEQKFDGWRAHPEVGGSEHGHGVGEGVEGDHDEGGSD